MFRRALLVVAIATTMAVGQGTPVGSTPPAPAGATQVYQTPVYVPAPSPIVGGYYTGYYGGNGGFYGLTTPSATFTAPQPTAGISLVDRTGISSTTPVAAGIQSTLAPSTLVYTNVQPVSPPAAEVTAVPAPPAPAPAAVTPDMGPSYFASAGGIGPSPAPAAMVSLGEVAAQYKSRTPQNVHTYTNAEVEQANASMKLGGIDVNARLGMPPMAPAAEIAQAQQPAQPSQVSRPSGAAAQPTTPQVGQPKPGEKPPVKELPATSTLLPLLGILGLAGGGIGLIFRRYRK
jgi:hypothetical protein